MASKGGDEDTHSTHSDTNKEETTKTDREEKQQPATTEPDQDDDEAGQFNTDHLLQEVSKKLQLHGSKECLEEVNESEINNKPNIDTETIDESKLKTEGTRELSGKVETNKTNNLEKEETGENSAEVDGKIEQLVKEETKSDENARDENTEVAQTKDVEIKTETVTQSKLSESKSDQTQSEVITQSAKQSGAVEDLKLEEKNDRSRDDLETETDEKLADVDVVAQTDSIDKDKQLEKRDGKSTDVSEKEKANTADDTTDVSDEDKANITDNTDTAFKNYTPDTSAADNTNTSVPQEESNIGAATTNEAEDSQESVIKIESDNGQTIDTVQNERISDTHPPPDDQEYIFNQRESAGKMEILNSEKNDESYLPDVNKTFQNTDEASNENEITNLPPISSDEQKSEKEDGMEEPPQEEEKQNQTNDKEVLSDRPTEQQSDRDGQHAGEVEQATKAEQEPQVDREPQQEYDETYHSTPVTDTDEQQKNDTERENRHGSENDGRDSVVDDREEDEHKEIPDETYGGLQDDYGKKSHRSDSSMSSRSEDSDKAKEDQKTEPVKQSQAQQSRKSVRMDDSVKTNKTSTTTTKTKGNTPSSSSNSSSPAHKHATRTTSRSAQPFRRPDHKPEASTKSTSFVSLRRPKTSNYGSMISRESNKKKDYFQEELRRLRVRLGKEAENIKKPQFKEHVPFVWTSLEPYYNTYVPNYLINLQGDDFHQGYTTRSTAIGLCDPWIDLRMDKNILPKLEQPKGQGRDKPKSQKKKKESSPKEGSTRLPKFPVVDFNSGKENATKKFPYNEVAKFRTELKDRFSSNAKKKVNKDYKRTKDDFYRMDLHKLDEIHPLNRPHMRRTYFAYLQNTPGSRKAVKDCVKTLDTDEGNEQDEQETPALEETHHQQAVAST